MTTPIVIGIVAGETSGDLLGAELIKSIRLLAPNARFVGVAGAHMLAAGCDGWFDIQQLSVMGIFELIQHLPRLWHIRRTLIRRFSELRPNIFIGIDAPDFNLTIELAMKKLLIPTVHYVSPSIWAWREQRVHQIARATDLVLSLLPFEKQFYDKYSVNCQFVGHPAADEMPMRPDQAQARINLGLPKDDPCLALLPGSRYTELIRIAKPFMQAAALLRQHYPNLVTVIPLLNLEQQRYIKDLHSQITPKLPIKIVNRNSREVLSAASVALTACGTATLECMLAKCPMVVGYRLHPFTFWLAKKLVKVGYTALPNLLADKPLVVELLQDDCTPDNLMQALLPLLYQDNSELKKRFSMLHEKIRMQASKHAAYAVLKLAKLIQ